MSTLRNQVQLIGHIGNQPNTISFDSGKKVTRFSMATNEVYRKEGEKVEQTTWHNLTAWGKQAELIEQYVSKGQEIAIQGKLNSRSYEDKDGNTQYLTEVIVKEVLFLGDKKA
ncbi:single-stranded DNA-binding protein [Salegentibacter sp. HM20]